MTRANRIDRRFAQLQADGRTALIPFVTAGDPFLDGVVPVMHALAQAGADVIELGVPFSDPMADGTTIQHADERALAAGVRLRDVLGWVRSFREQDADTPIVLMGYMNPVAIYGVEAFATDAASAGVDGVLLVDCPLEESAATEALRAAGLCRIQLAAPTTTDARLKQLCAAGSGYLYYVSVAGITGTTHLSAATIAARVGALRAQSPVPVAVGFGIRTPAQAQQVAAFADAVVMGSALVAALAEAADVADAVKRAQAFLAPVRAALDATHRSSGEEERA